MTLEIIYKKTATRQTKAVAREVRFIEDRALLLSELKTLSIPLKDIVLIRPSNDTPRRHSPVIATNVQPKFLL